MAAITRLSLDGYGARRAGSFADRARPVGRITRLSLDGYGARRAGSFAGRAAVDGGSDLPAYVGFQIDMGMLGRF